MTSPATTTFNELKESKIGEHSIIKIYKVFYRPAGF